MIGFKDFVKAIEPSFIFNWHHDLICKQLQEFAQGSIKKLMVLMPPRHSKSILVSKLFPAYLLGVKSECKIFASSYSDYLCRLVDRQVSDIMNSKAYLELFPNAHKNYTAKGVDVSIPTHIGDKANVGIIDDPIKDAVQANDVESRNKLWNWYCEDFSKNLSADAQKLIVMSRWHEKDLVGKILDNEKDWVIIKLEAIKSAHIIKGDKRAIGEPLWEKRYSLEFMQWFNEKNTHLFNALYQQTPAHT